MKILLWGFLFVVNLIMAVFSLVGIFMYRSEIPFYGRLLIVFVTLTCLCYPHLRIALGQGRG